MNRRSDGIGQELRQVMKEELLFDEISERDQNVNNCAHLERKGEGRRKTGKRKIHQWTAHMSRRVCSAKLCGAS